MATYDWAMVNPNTGNIDYIMSVNNNSDYARAGLHNGLRTYPIASDANHTKAIEETYFDFTADMFKPRNKRPGDYYIWNDAQQWAVDSTRLLADFKSTRANKLYECDWTQASDAPLTDEKKAEWVTYRQKLRDAPAGLPDNFDNLEGYVWPTKP
tara:strand:+ start:208 stop:669 length:462 start_codon:yes stop_codon:yes gene_type:complete